MDDSSAENSEQINEQLNEQQHVEEVSLYFLLFAALLAFVIILSKILHGRPRLNTYISEAALTLLVGIGSGLIVHLCFLRNLDDPYDYAIYDDDNEQEAVVVATSLLSFDGNVFYMALLPPILFQSGYAIRRELFYRHIKPIVLYSVVGTTVSAICTAFLLRGISLLGWMGRDSNLNTFDPSLLELLTFGSMIAATDTVSVLAVFQSKQVDPHLFYLVFGESALNDAVALVLFKTFAASVNGEGSIAYRATACILDFAVQAIGSPVVGAIFAFGTALLFKHMDFRDTPMLELPLYVVLLLYVPFITAECLNLSGIVAIFFSGISARRYILPNISDDTARNTEAIFKIAAYLAETCIFLELGLSLFGLAQSFKWRFICWAFLAAMLSRAVAIFPLTWLHNYSLKFTPCCSTSTDDDATAAPQDCTSNDVDEDAIVAGAWTVSSVGIISDWKTPTRRLDRRISNKFATVLWFAGMRGAVAYACAKQFPAYFGHNDEFTAATMAIVLFTIIVMGGLLGNLLDALEIQTGIDFEEYMKEWHKRRRLKGRFHRFEHQYIYRNVVRSNADDISCMGDDPSVDQEASFRYVSEDALSEDAVNQTKQFS